MTATVLVPTEVRAGHNAWSHCNADPNWYADQNTANLYTGIAGWFFTYQPFVPNVNTDFSLSHLYAFRDVGATFVEGGVYRGFGPQKIAMNSSYYSARAEPGQPYKENNYEDAPTNTSVKYKVQNIGFRDVVQKWAWGVYMDDFGNPKVVWEMAHINWAQALSGGEVTRDRGIEMPVRMTPSHQILNPGDGLWYNWTDATMSLLGDSTATCNDPGFSISYNVRFDDYQVTGTGP